MKKQLTEEQIIQLSQQLRDHATGNLDLSVSHQLTAARHKAINAKTNRYSVLLRRGGLVLAMGLLLLMFWQVDVDQSAVISDDLLLVEEMPQTEESQELLQDLEFYQWLDDQAKQGKLV